MPKAVSNLSKTISRINLRGVRTVNKRVLGVVSTVGAVAIVLAGCGKGGDVATVNGQNVSRADFCKYMQARVGKQMLSQMLNGRVTLALAEKEGVSPSDKDVDAYYKTFSKMMDVSAILEQSGLTPDDLKSELKVQIADQNIDEKAFGKDITDASVKQMYEMQKSRYDIPERVKVDLVFFKTKAAADKAYAEIQKGKTLEDITATPSPENSSVIPQVIQKGPGMSPVLVKAAFDTPEGQVSKPFETEVQPGQKQWIILKSGKKTPAVKISFDEAKPIIKGELAKMKASGDTQYQKKLAEQRKAIKVVVLDPGLKSVEKELNKPQQ